AMEEAIAYANGRVQFGQKLIAFPRVADKIAMMAAEIMIARQISYYAAREKDKGRRCDLEAGMAKLLAARVAWAAADNAVQIHGGNGFALEYRISRILCDARILSIFEGAAEIQAQVIARRVLDGANWFFSVGQRSQPRCSSASGSGCSSRCLRLPRPDNPSPHWQARMHLAARCFFPPRASGSCPSMPHP